LNHWRKARTSLPALLDVSRSGPFFTAQSFQFLIERVLTIGGYFKISDGSGVCNNLDSHGFHASQVTASYSHDVLGHVGQQERNKAINMTHDGR